MSRAGILRVALAAAAVIVPAHAADKRYPVDSIKQIDIVDPSSGSAWENKNLLDCADVVLTEDDVRYALRHMRKVSKKSYFSEDTQRTGCSGGASVTFKNGKTIVVGIEPTGRINVFESNAKLDPIAGTESFYDCEPCNDRKMALLKDALGRATDRRLRSARPVD
jgi:hypothetical protein